MTKISSEICLKGFFWYNLFFHFGFKMFLSKHKPLWETRPNIIQESIDNAWEELQAHTKSPWSMDGRRGDYELAGINSIELFKNIIVENPERKEFYVLDIGAGEFGFSNTLIDHLNTDKNLPKDIKVHIISLSGENLIWERNAKTMDFVVNIILDRLK